MSVPADQITPPETPPDSETDMLAAMDAGIAAATDAPPEVPPEVPPEGEAAPDVATPPEGEAPVAPPDATKPDATKPEGEATQAPGEEEAATLGLKGKANERFREMSAEIAGFAPLRDALKEAGVADVAQLQAAITQAKEGRELQDYITSTGVDGAQFGQTLDYLSLVAKAKAGDTKAAELAFQTIEGEYLSACQALGKTPAAQRDPLDGHEDLRAAVTSLEITAERAKELAQLRNEAKQGQQRTEAETAAQRERVEAEDRGRADLTRVGHTLQRIDAAFYTANREQIVALAKQIAGQHPPGEWGAKFEEAYAALPREPAPPVPPAKPVPGPLRPGGPRPALAPTFDTPEAAMDYGIRLASGLAE